MKRTGFLARMIAHLFIVFITACNYPDSGFKTDEKMDSALNAQKEGDKENILIKEKEKSKVRINKAIENIDVRISKLQEELLTANSKSKKIFAEKKNRLEKIRMELEIDLNEIDNLSEDDWRNFEKRMNETADSAFYTNANAGIY